MVFDLMAISFPRSSLGRLRRLPWNIRKSMIRKIRLPDLRQDAQGSEPVFQGALGSRWWLTARPPTQANLLPPTSESLMSLQGHRTCRFYR